MENKEHEDGVYFNMPDDEYHAIKRLSSTGIKNMMISPATFWAKSWMNPDRDEEEELTPEQIKVRNLGKAYHYARLQPELLHEKCVGEPDYKSMKGILTNGSQIEDKLASYGKAKKKKGEKVLDQARRLEAYGYTGPILHIEKDDFEKTIKGRIVIAGKLWQQLLRDMERIKKNPEISDLLSGGFSEVSVLWTCPDTGIKMKCRFDYLKPRAFTDFKSFENWNGKPLEQTMIDAFTYNRYYIQGAFYWQGAEAIRTRLVKAIHGTEPQIQMINRIQESETPLRPWFVFQEKKGVPNLLAYHLRMYNGDVHNHSGLEDNSSSVDYSEDDIERLCYQHNMLSGIHMKAKAEIDHVKKLYLRNVEVFGDEGEEWFTKDPVRVLRDEDFNPYWLERRPVGLNPNPS